MIITESASKVNSHSVCRICKRSLLENSIYSYDGYCFYHYPIGMNENTLSDGGACASGKLGYKDVSGENTEKSVTACVSRTKKNQKVSKEIQYITGDIIEKYQYEFPIVTGRQIEKKKKKKKKKKALDKYRKDRREKILNRLVKIDNVKRSRSRKKKDIRRLVNSNCTKKNRFFCSFFTCTYKENEQDEYKAREDFNKFIKRLQYNYPGKYYSGKNGVQRFLDFTRYIWCIERQMLNNRGAIHFHVVFFDCPYLHFSKFQELWGLGTIDVHQLNFAKNTGAYICKYFEETDDSFFKNPIIGKTWCKSQSLNNADIQRFFDWQELKPGEEILKQYTYQTEVNGFCCLSFVLRN